MLRRLRETGPAVLVPLAWAFVGAAHLGYVSERTLFLAHVVMSVLLAVFAATGRSDMREGTLRVWWWVVAVGLVVTVAGAAGFLIDALATPLHAVALLGWMLLPAVGFVDTGRRPGGARHYLVSGISCVLGAALYVFGTVGGAGNSAIAGIAVVGLAQTAGIVDAVAWSGSDGSRNG